MKKKSAVLGKVDPEALRDPRVARLHSAEFEKKLLEGMREAKAAALRKQHSLGVPKAARAASKA